MQAGMCDCYEDDDAVPNLIERRFFAATDAVRMTQVECDVLREVAGLAIQSWREARTRLAELEALREGFGREL